MPRFIAFLRAVNVGGRVVKMDALRKEFEALGFSGVETFIASGNVIFETRSTSAAALEKKIETQLRKSLGYDVATFLRTDNELAAIARYRPFAAAELAAAGNALYVAFTSVAPSRKAKKKLLTFRSDVDDFHVHDREVYWLCRTKSSESEFSGAVLEKLLGMPATLRNVTTVRKIAEKYYAFEKGEQ